jgi:hypothetical protein
MFWKFRVFWYFYELGYGWKQSWRTAHKVWYLYAQEYDPYEAIEMYDRSRMVIAK